MNFRPFKALAPFLLLAIASCGVPHDTVYFQDSTEGSVESVSANPKIKFKPGDKIYILVNSKDASLMNLFNLIIPTNLGSTQTSGRGSTSSTNGLGGSSSTAYYIVDEQGDIEFPVLGKIHAAGLTREELATYLQNELRVKDHVRDAVVTVEYKDMSVSVMGEVASPGKYAISRDRITLVDVIANAGDITMFGRRDCVKVYREGPDGQRHTYRVNMTSADSTFNSPVYYLQQDDIVYVEPNDTKRRQGTANGNAPLTPAFWISVASFALTLGILIFK